MRSIALLAVVILLFGTPGCGNGTAGFTETESKARLTKLLRLYQLYSDKKRASPAKEQDLREFAQQLTAQEREAYLVGEDLEGIFISTRDNQPFVIKYNQSLKPGGEPRAVAWEATGHEGRRYVALSIGYVEEYDEQMFQQYNK